MLYYVYLAKNIMSENRPSPQKPFSLEQENLRLKKEIEELKNALDEARNEAGTDFLTKLPNRSSLLNSLDIELDRVKRGGKLAVLMIDLDKFKEVNDTYGHEQGDTVLKEFSKGIKNGLRKTDTFGRYGGEEFLVILPLKDGTSPEQLTSVLKRYKAAARKISRSGKPRNEDWLTFSGGCIMVDKNIPISVDEIIRLADENLYVSKENGRNKITLTRIPKRFK